MGIKRQPGFTIVETVLVLAVTGLLVMTILIGSGVAIGQQRYHDSVNSLEAVLQQQYDDIRNVSNARTTTDTCSLTGDNEPRGRSDCMIVGRLIEIDPANDSGDTISRLKLSNVLAYPNTATPAKDNIIANINSYNLAVSTVDQETVDVAWDSTIVSKSTNGPAIAKRILIVQAPDLGSTLTFVGNPLLGSATLNSLVTDNNAKDPLDLCVQPSSALLGHRQAVRLDAYASTSAAVEVPKESDNVCA